ncbi:MAG TPA: hypothetical protein VG649_10385 [Candidatus Angelobacter sp.]|nr:hypothetical protein [Candidatus Angelobacter sp.]
MRSVSFLLFSVVLSATALIGCGGSTAATSPPPPPPPTTGSLYAINGITSTVLRFDAGANGNVSPQAMIKGAATQIMGAASLMTDAVNDRLFVSDFQTSSILVFDHASTKAGNVVPDRIISGAATTLHSQGDLVLDRANDQFYVNNTFSNNILVFGSASTINGNVAPTRIINTGFIPGSMTLDAGSNRLFLTTSNSIMIYDGASTLNGTVTANRMISGASTQLDFPGAMQLDGSGRLFVGNGTPVHGTQSILIYANAGSANGNVVPSAVIAGPNTMLDNQIGLALPPSGEIFVGQFFNVLVFAPAATANGNISPVRVLAGDKTGLFTTPGFGNVTGMTVDPNH